MNKTLFEIPKMDCPSEEQLIRIALAKSPDIKDMQFDLKGRQLAVIHEGNEQRVLSLLVPLGFGTKIVESQTISIEDSMKRITTSEGAAGEAKVLRQLLAINGFMFFAEFAYGWHFQSTGLIADSLDMFSDACVYGLSLYAVGKAASLKNRAARLSGYIQLLLASGALFEVGRRAIVGSEPEPFYMVGVSLIALLANLSCLVLLARHREGEVHMQASWIFSTNDVIANLGVIVAGILVYVTGLHIFDLVMGAIVGVIVLNGAKKILKISAQNPL